MWSNTRTSTKLYGELTEQCEVDRIPNHPQGESPEMVYQMGRVKPHKRLGFWRGWHNVKSFNKFHSPFDISQPNGMFKKNECQVQYLVRIDGINIP